MSDLGFNIANLQSVTGLRMIQESRAANIVADPAGPQIQMALPMNRPVLYLDQTWPTPEENVAADEALLAFCTAHPEHQVLRCWESPTHFVVLGHANQRTAEVDLQACERLGWPVLRRCSGGGTVLQGPGCLNYALVLRLDAHPHLSNVPSTNRFIMEQHRACLAQLTGQPVQVRGITDLSLQEQKFSGNAQKRGRHHLLFHGTFLLQFRLEAIAQALKLPTRAPAYRQGRSHLDFLTNLPIDPGTLKQALRTCWSATTEWTAGPLTPFLQQSLVERYAQEAWHQKF
jgi:lipoate-protein ligase A